MENFSKALNYAFLLLRFRPRSEHEIRTRLKKRKISPPVVKKVIDYLRSCNYINDHNFVKSYIESALVKGWGPIRVNLNLKRSGVAYKLRKQAVENIESQSNKIIKELLEKKINHLKKSGPNLDKKKLKRKIIRFLANKGFYYKDIFANLNKDYRENENR